MSYLISQFSNQYIFYALVAALILGITAPLVGVFVIQKKLSFAGDSLGHLAIAAAGISLAFNISQLIVSILVITIASLIIFELQTRYKLNGDFALATVSVTGISIGLIFAAKSSQSQKFQELLFGSLLTINKENILFLILISIFIILFILFCNKALFSISIDEVSAKLSGLPTGLLSRLFYCSIGVVVIMGMNTVGILLTGALLIIPSGTGLLVGKSLTTSLIYSSIFGGLSSLIGIVISVIFDFVPSASIVCSATILLILTKLFKRFLF